MGHKVFIRDMVVITREIELPDACPHCKADLSLGSTNLEAWQLRPRLEQLRLTAITTEGETTEVAGTVNILPSADENWIRMPVMFRCHACKRVLYRMHHKEHALKDMDPAMAFKLRDLLYDRKARDPLVLQKCFDQTIGYHSDCLACNIEAEIGTEEVPHPIDERLHSCLKRLHNGDAQ